MTTPPNPSGICMCGCGRTTPRASKTQRSDGAVAGEHTRYCVGHHGGFRHRPPRKDPAPIADRFWPKVDRRGPDECWEWRASRMRHGYGQMGVGSRLDGTKHMEGAHRISWQIHFGPIPDGLLVCHTCDNRPCVNPAHLFLGTVKDNTHDMIAKGRARYTAPKGEENGNAKLTASDVRAIRACYAEGATQVALAREYGVPQTQISRIVRRGSWKHVA